MTRISRALRLGVVCTAAAWLSSGCTTRVADLTLVSTKNIDLSNATLDAREGRRAKGEDCIVSILGIPLGVPNLETAVDDALERGRGNVLIDEVTYLKSFTLILFGQDCLEVEGTVLTTAEGP